MKLKDIGINYNGSGATLVLWVCDDDDTNIRQWRGSLKAVLHHVFSDLSLNDWDKVCLLYTSPSPRDVEESRMPSSA